MSVPYLQAQEEAVLAAGGAAVTGTADIEVGDDDELIVIEGPKEGEGEVEDIQVSGSASMQNNKRGRDDVVAVEDAEGTSKIRKM